MKYAVKTKFFDNGRVSATVFSCDENMKANSKSYPSYDEYIDIFDTREEAENWKQDAYNC